MKINRKNVEGIGKALALGMLALSISACTIEAGNVVAFTGENNVWVGKINGTEEGKRSLIEGEGGAPVFGSGTWGETTIQSPDAEFEGVYFPWRVDIMMEHWWEDKGKPWVEEHITVRGPESR